MDAAGGRHVPGVGGGAQRAARVAAWPLAADEGQDREGAPRLPAAGRRSCCGRSALYPLWGEHSVGQAGLAPLACAMLMLVPFSTAPLLRCPQPHCPTQPGSPLSHTGPPSTVTPRHTAWSGLGDGTATLRTYRSANEICGNRREGVRQGRGSAAHSRPASLCRWVKPMGPSSSHRLLEGPSPPGYSHPGSPPKAIAWGPRPPVARHSPLLSVLSSSCSRSFCRLPRTKARKERMRALRMPMMARM